ncbi:hypothetical protein CDL12_09114 [Handroanthus impetiginosus]|uniref:Transmembrane protein n=1 Tax=Handroanthus impetiginosus TaxID=429701 RepID=A0A2G9HL22_9LAMI|nr:hypothetical protein CDL12_09114 [Handroanthus impetiginosus]
MFVTSLQSFMPHPSSNFTSETSSNPAQITRHLRQDSSVLCSLGTSFCIYFGVISFFSAISTIVVSSVSYCGENLSLKELLLRTGTTWARPLITTFYASGLTIGYFVFIIALVTPSLLPYTNHPILFIMPIFQAILAFIFYLYLFVPWALAIVVSVVEESCYGIEALRKATVLVEGKRSHGFLLLICSNFVVFIILLGYKMILGNKGFVNQTLINVLFSVSVSVLVKIFLVVAYTVLYFECKNHHGEEMESHGSLEYTEVPTHDKLANDMP